MKRILCILSALCIAAAMPLSALAQDVTNTGGSAQLTVEVPAKQNVSVQVIGNGNILINDSADITEVDRQAQVVIAPICEDGNVLKSLVVNGIDVTEQMADGKYIIDRLHEDIVVEVTFEKNESSSSDESSDSESSSSDESSDSDSSSDSQSDSSSQADSSSVADSSSASKADSSAVSSSDKSSSTATQNGANTVSPNTGIAIGISGGTILCAAAIFVISGRKKKDKE